MLSEAQVAGDIHNVEVDSTSRRGRIPENLSFEDIIKKNTLPPCSLGDFMDYLVCEEENAEILQFFTWFCGYVVRWSALSAQEKLQSPPWKPAESTRPVNKGGRKGRPISLHTQRRTRSNRLNQILEILDGKNVQDNIRQISDQSHKKGPDPWNFSTPRQISDANNPQPRTVPMPSDKEQVSLEDVDAQRCARQPFRHEITQIVQHYINNDAPRRLQISDEDLVACLEAVKITTHPSAFLPAFMASEAILKSHSHPKFIHQSPRNANKPRLVLIRILSIIFVCIGLVLSLLLILSPAARFWRVASIFLWWPGFTTLIASAQGICLCLYICNLRQIPPWEPRGHGDRGVAQQKDDEDDLSVVEVKTTITSDNAQRKTHARTSSRSVSVVSFVTMAGPSAVEFSTTITSDKDMRAPSRVSSHRNSANSSYTASDPAANLKPKHQASSMQVLGAANCWEQQARAEAYAAKSLRQKIWDDAVKTQNRDIRLLQDRTVLLAVCWGGALSAALTIATLWIPSVDII